jgi:tetratricopeptide (TPR) repeat protein
MNPDPGLDELQKLRSAVSSEPRNAQLRYLLAAEMAQARDFQGAVLEFSAAIALDPMLHMARFQLGLLHLTLAQPDHMSAVLAPLEALGDDNALKHFKWGLESLAKEELERSIDNFRCGIELNSSNAPLNRDMQLIVDRVRAVLAEQADITTPAAPHAPESSVRTDFSLYSDATKH